MKNKLIYPELLQKKRTTLPVNGSADAGWQRMRTILDQQMPVPGALKKTSRFKLPKWGLHVFVGISSVAAIYMGSQLYFSNKNQGLPKPDTQQIHRAPVPPITNDTSLAQDIIKPTINANTPENTAAYPLFNDQIKHNNDTASKDKPKRTDPIIAPDILNIPARRDSLIMPIETVPLKALGDSIPPLDLGKKEVPKDTSNNLKKPVKRKKRGKFSVFF